jgi:hypothetical protein
MISRLAPLRAWTRRLLTAALACTFAASAWAQAPELPGPIGARDTETRVLPVWSNSNGRFEALLLIDPAEPVLSGSALDRVLNTRTPTLGLGAQTTLSNGRRLQGSLQLETDGLALLCDDRNGLSRALVSLGEHCLLAKLGSDDPLIAGSANGARMGLELSGSDLDLSFGLSWLSLQAQPQVWAGSTPALARLGGEPNPLDLISAWAQRFESQQLRVDSLFHLGPDARVLLGGDLSRNRLQTLSGQSLDWESAALSLGLGYGNFTGRLTGRLIGLPQGAAPWRTLDIGVSWRTPWRGELSVGARNVLGRPDTSRWPLAELPAVDDPSERVPYVRYQQDL